MRYVSAYLLAVLGGNEQPSASDIENILGAVGIDTDAEKSKTVVSKLSGKTLQDLIAEGSKHLVSVSGGGAPAAAAPAAGGAPAAAAPTESKKKEEPKEESDDDMGFGLFD